MAGNGTEDCEAVNNERPPKPSAGEFSPDIVVIGLISWWKSLLDCCIKLEMSIVASSELGCKSIMDPDAAAALANA
jgi:hypothetical protein